LMSGVMPWRYKERESGGRGTVMLAALNRTAQLRFA
jgi:hypothetical protein